MPGLGSLTVYLNSNSTGLERGLARAEKLLKKFAVASAGYMAVSSLKKLAEESLNLAGVQQRAENLMARTLQNTAGMAEFTVGELKRYASEAQSISIFGDEKVMEAQTRLMQMNAVTGDAFRQTRKVALDIASATGQDLTAVMQTLGKAMQDPVKGIRQLREFGTDPAIKNQIEEVIAAQGREAAQLILLADLQKRYQGAAEEAADTIDGAFKQNANAISDLKESFGFLINELFGIQDGLKTTSGWFADWAKYIRDHAAEISYAFRSVWNDIKFGAQKLYAFVAPVINQISSIVEAAARNIIEFYRAIPRLLNGEDFQMKLYTPAYNLFQEYKQLGETLDALTREQNAAQGKIDREFSLKMSKQAEQNIARGAAAGTQKGMEQAVKEQQKRQFENPAAVEGSQDAWKIITAAMRWTDKAQTQASPAAIVPASPAVTSPEPQTAVKTPARPVSAAPEITRNPVEPVPAVTPVKLFDPNSSATQISSRDVVHNLADVISVLNPAVLAGRIIGQSVARPQSLRTAYDVVNAPQAQQENFGTRILMGITSLFDSRNHGARYAAGADSPITKDQIKSAREQRNASAPVSLRDVFRDLADKISVLDPASLVRQIVGQSAAGPKTEPKVEPDTAGSSAKKPLPQVKVTVPAQPDPASAYSAPAVPQVDVPEFLEAPIRSLLSSVVSLRDVVRDLADKISVLDPASLVRQIVGQSAAGPKTEPKVEPDTAGSSAKQPVPQVKVTVPAQPDPASAYSAPAVTQVAVPEFPEAPIRSLSSSAFSLRDVVRDLADSWRNFRPEMPERKSLAVTSGPSIRFAADREQIKLAREQLAAIRETNRKLSGLSSSPANLFGGLF